MLIVGDADSVERSNTLGGMSYMASNEDLPMVV
jgi:hypothetical protein